jgi:hypothetical protein
MRKSIWFDGEGGFFVGEIISDEDNDYLSENVAHEFMCDMLHAEVMGKEFFPSPLCEGESEPDL